MKKITFLFVFSLFILAACNRLPVDVSPQSIGLPDAPILVEVFADLQCPACAATSPKLEQLIRDNPGLARFDYYHFPLSQNQYAFVAAEAAECASDQGKFWEYTGQVYKTQANLNEDHLYNLADALELDSKDFDSCMKNRKYKGKIQSHMAEGVRRKISGTPAIFVNGKTVSWTNSKQFKEYLENL